MGGLLTSFQQDIFAQSATKKHRLGTLRIEEDGRKYRYAKSGEALTAGNLAQGVAAVANHIKQTVAAAGAASVGDMQVTFTLGATACTANQYDDGMLQIYDGAAGTVGHQYRISAHGVSAAGSETITVTLREPIRKAIIATDTWSLVPNPWNGTLENGAVAGFFAGVSPIAVTSGYYYWAQTGGEAIGLNTDATALGGCLELSATSGSYKIGADFLGGVLGQSYGYASITAKYNPIFLTHD